MQLEDLDLDLQAFYEASDCCRDIVKLRKENYTLRENISQLYRFIESPIFEERFESQVNSLYVKAKIKHIIGWSMNNKEIQMLKNVGEIPFEGDSNE